VNRKSTWGPLVPIIVALLYGASPLDLIPDIIPLLGWVDDGLMGMVMMLISGFLLIRKLNDSRKPAFVQQGSARRIR
jgi:uncharacterized membrane protein YkvA (DUF1232 family)